MPTLLKSLLTFSRSIRVSKKSETIFSSFEYFYYNDFLKLFKIKSNFRDALETELKNTYRMPLRALRNILKPILMLGLIGLVSLVICVVAGITLPIIGIILLLLSPGTLFSLIAAFSKNAIFLLFIPVYILFVEIPFYLGITLRAVGELILWPIFILSSPIRLICSLCTEKVNETKIKNDCEEEEDFYINLGIPKDVVGEIIQYCDLRTTGALAQSCKAFNQLVKVERERSMKLYYTVSRTYLLNTWLYEGKKNSLYHLYFDSAVDQFDCFRIYHLDRYIGSNDMLLFRSKEDLLAMFQLFNTTYTQEVQENIPIYRVECMKKIISEVSVSNNSFFSAPRDTLKLKAGSIGVNDREVPMENLNRKQLIAKGI